jgi:hypothetical protein
MLADLPNRIVLSMRENHMMTYAEAIRPVRNKLRKFSYFSVLGELSQFITAESTVNDNNAHAPWLAERVAVWVLRDEPRMLLGAN